MTRPKAKRADLARAKRMGKMVKEARDRNGWTQARLAEEAGCSLGYVRNIEQGTSRNPSLFPMLRVARVLELGLDELSEGIRSTVGKMPRYGFSEKALVALPGRLPRDLIKGKRVVISGRVAEFKPGAQPHIGIKPVDVRWEEE